jgi:membrane protein
MEASRDKCLRASHIARCVWRESFTDRTFMVAAGVAFFALFSLLPATAVMGLLLAWILQPETLEGEVIKMAATLPEGTPALLKEFLVSAPSSLAAGLGLSVNLLIVFWTIQRAASGLITALNVVYDEDEGRGRVRREAVAIGIAIGGLLFLYIALYFALVVPAIVAAEGLFYWLASLRWLFLTALFAVGLSLLYAYAPCREGRDWRTIGWASGIATALWLLASLLFALYMNTVGGWDVYYGSVTAAVVLMTWLFITAFVVMIGAEVDAQISAILFPKRTRGIKNILDQREGA